jgi:signal peptidase I
MKYARIFAVAIVAFALATPAGAKTTKWAGGATGGSSAKSGTAKSFVDPANWDNGVPAPGDTVVFDTTSDYNNQIFVGGQDGSTYTNEFFDIGSAGLTIDMQTSYVWINVNFTGPGKIVRTGKGYFKPLCDSDFTGGAEIQNGSLPSH